MSHNSVEGPDPSALPAVAALPAQAHFSPYHRDLLPRAHSGPGIAASLSLSWKRSLDTSCLAVTWEAPKLGGNCWFREASKNGPQGGHSLDSYCGLRLEAESAAPADSEQQGYQMFLK